jgi:hypothetical protein
LVTHPSRTECIPASVADADACRTNANIARARYRRAGLVTRGLVEPNGEAADDCGTPRRIKGSPNSKYDDRESRPLIQHMTRNEFTRVKSERGKQGGIMMMKFYKEWVSG